MLEEVMEVEEVMVSILQKTRNLNLFKGLLKVLKIYCNQCGIKEQVDDKRDWIADPSIQQPPDLPGVEGDERNPLLNLKKFGANIGEFGQNLKQRGAQFGENWDAGLDKFTGGVRANLKQRGAQFQENLGNLREDVGSFYDKNVGQRIRQAQENIGSGVQGLLGKVGGGLDSADNFLQKLFRKKKEEDEEDPYNTTSGGMQQPDPVGQGWSQYGGPQI